ncbi:MAG: DMT family transporter, partial [Chloroflexota bacterium]
MLLISMWFGLQAWFTQSAIHVSSALAFNTERYLIAALVMGGICLVTRAKFTRRGILGGFLVGVAYAFTIGFESQALGQGAAGRVTFLGSLFVAIMPFLAYATRSEKLYPAAILGSVIMLMGAWQLLGVQDGAVGGDIYGILRALACAIMLLLVGRHAQEDWRISCFSMFVVIAGISFVGALITGQTQFSVQTEVLLPVLASALVGSVVCMAAMTWAGRYLSGSVMGVIFFLDSPFAVIWGVLLYKEALNPSSFLAYVFIVIGAIFALTAGKLQTPQ